ncbi:MAG: hypothetical protein NXI23_07655 [Bacteroidetes bacterium]|nr:hypothetical protein [Bacteroidota bacterium]
MKHQFMLLSAISILFLLHSCINKIDEIKVNYQGTLAFPLADISFEVNDLLEDDSILSVDNNNGIQLLHQEDSLALIKAEDFFEEITDSLNVTGYYKESIGKIQLNNYSKNTTVPFEQFLNEFNNPAIQQFFQNNNGQSVPTMAIDEQVDLKVPLEPFDEFTSIQVEYGIIQLTLHNGYFIDIQDLSLIIYDEIAGQNVGTITFPSIPVGETRTEELVIANQNINNEISFLIPSLTSPANTNPVLVDLASELEIEIVLSDFIITDGEVRLMGNEVLKDSTFVDFEPSNDSELAQIDLDNGIMNYSMMSDFSLELKVTIIFPNVIKNGNPLNVSMTLPPTGVNDSITGMIDFSGTSIFLDQNQNQPFNKMLVELEAQVEDPTNSLVLFDAQDVLSFRFEMSNIQVKNAFGYFGKFKENIDLGSIDLGFDFGFINENSAATYFDNATLKLESENSFGVPILLDFQMTSFGILDPDQQLEAPEFDIPYPTFDQFGETIFGEYLIDQENSNISDFLSIYPSLFEYEGSAEINSKGNQGEINFVTKSSELILNGTFDLPFELRANNIIYRDTVDAFSFDLEDELTIEDIREGELKLLYENSMPFKVTLDILTVGFAGNSTILIENTTLSSGIVNDEGIVDSNGNFIGETFINLSQDQIFQMDEAKETIFELRLDSSENGNVPVSILTDSGLDMKIGLKLFLDTQ